MDDNAKIRLLDLLQEEHSKFNIFYPHISPYLNAEESLYGIGFLVCETHKIRDNTSVKRHCSRSTRAYVTGIKS